MCKHLKTAKQFFFFYSDSVSNSNAVPFSQCIYNPMTNSNEMSHSNQMRNSYSQSANNNNQIQQQLIQQQQHRQQIITTPQTQLSYSGQLSHGHLTSIEQQKSSRNVEHFVNTPATETIDLSSHSGNPTSSTVQETSISPSVGWILRKIPERIWENADTNISAYQVNKTINPHPMSSPYKHIHGKLCVWNNTFNTVICLILK